MKDIELQAERKAFEAWYEAYCMPSEADWFRRDVDDESEYHHAITADAWAAWQARAAVEADRAQRVPAEVIKYAKAMQADGYLGPFLWAKVIIDYVATLASTPAQPAQQTLPEAMKTVIAEMQSDPDYAWTWHCNVAMAMVDAGCDPVMANQGAARFMRVLANVEPAHELPSAPAPHQEPPQPVERKPMTRSQISKASGDAQIAFCLDKQPTYEVALVREVERHHGIRE